MKKKLLLLIPTSLFFLSSCIFQEILHIKKTLDDDKYDLVELKEGTIDDVSKLNNTKIKKVFKLQNENQINDELIAILKTSKEKNLKVSIAGKKHSMGGQTIYPDGIQIDMLKYNKMSIDKENSILNVQSGAIWSDIIPFLDKNGFAIKVMQSDSPFSVGGSISVNCHGWQNDSQSIASTVDSFRILLASGKILNCSRKENKELFSLALGGYGLFGIILDVSLKIMPNERYSYNHIVLKSKNYVETYNKYIKDNPNLRMAYGRISIGSNSFLEEAIFYYMLHEPTKDNYLPPLVLSDKINTIARGIYRGSVGNDFGKNLRWKAEKDWQPLMQDKYFSRNQLMIGDVKSFENTSWQSTDILHEYFIPPRNFNRFLKVLKKNVKAFNVDMLNITVRNIKEDKDTFLKYAKEDMFSFVISFNYKTTEDADKNMEKMTQKMIDEIIKLDGAYYLPYRLHATKEQFLKIYPMAKDLLDLKKKYDPDMIFQNKLFLKYF